MMKNNLNIRVKRCMSSVLLTLLFSITFSTVVAQNPVLPMTENTSMFKKGQYDIRMISSPVLHPVWIRYGATQMDVIDRVTTDQQLQLGVLATRNNDLSGLTGNVFTKSDAARICDVAPLAAMDAAKTGAKIGLSYADCDTFRTTFQSSASFLDFGSEVSCTTIKSAYLYWVGSTGTSATPYVLPYSGSTTMRSFNGSSTPIPSSANYNKVLFRHNNDKAYTQVTALASNMKTTSGGQYICSADVTNLVKGKGGGLFWVANVVSSNNVGSPIAGWTLVVIFTPPNCPTRIIRFWEGNSQMGGCTNCPGQRDINFSFAANEVPNSGNSVSYLGICALDAEAYAPGVMPAYTTDQMKTIAIGFKSMDASNVEVGKANPDINVFTEHPYYEYYNEQGSLVTNALDGILCSRISSYDKENHLNGNDLIRMPDNRYTAGYDSHHIKLPTGALGAGARKAAMTVVCEKGPNECGGGYTPFLAYMAIELLQPNLKLYKTSKADTVLASGEITYELKVTNIGPLKSVANALITDTLDLPVDFVPSSVQYLDKLGNIITPPTPFEIVNQGADNGEYLKFYLPEVEKGINELPQDSIRIQFKVKLKGLDRMDIWNIGCRRVVKNKATLYFKTSTGADAVDLVAGSNSTVGCGGSAEYAQVKVADKAIEEMYLKTHFVDTILTTQVNNALNLGTPLNIVSTLKAILIQRLGSMNFPISNANNYIFQDEQGNVISPSATFTQVVPIQNYKAVWQLSEECPDTYNFSITVAKVPKATIQSKKTGCVGDNDGVLKLSLYDGDPGYRVKVVNANGDTIFRANTLDANLTDTLNVEGLLAGKYTVVVGDKGIMSSVDTVSVTEPALLKVNITGDSLLCIGKQAVLTANVTGRAPNVVLEYAWQQSNDNITWVDMPGETAKTLTITPPASGFYQVFVCDKSCSSSDIIKVSVNPIPVVKLQNDTTVSITVDPTAQFTANVSVGVGPYTYQWQGYNKSTWSALTSPSTSGMLGSYSFASSNSVLNVSGIKAASPNLEMDGYQYAVKVIDPIGCASSDTALLGVVRGPAVTRTHVKNVTCPGDTNGEISFNVASGEPGQHYKISLYAGIYSDAASLAAASPTSLATIADYTAPGSMPLGAVNCAASAYTVVLEPLAPIQPGIQTWYNNPQTGLSYANFVISSPDPIVASITTNLPEQCKSTTTNKYLVNLSGSVSGGQKDGSSILQFTWEKSLDGISFSTNDLSPSGTNLPVSMIESGAQDNNFTESSYYRISANDNGSCPTSSPVIFVKGLETPEIGFEASVDTGCYKYDLHNLKVLQLNDKLKNGEYTLTLHSQKPSDKDPNDNRYIIPESDYIYKKDAVVYARLYSGATCLSVAPVSIVLRTMESCYPIYIPDFFSPDGDGINDLFQMANLEEYDNPKITIYDRFGKVVFEGGKEKLLPPNGWDGKYLGHPLPSADYWYQMTFAEMKPKVGHFSLKRKKE